MFYLIFIANLRAHQVFFDESNAIVLNISYCVISFLVYIRFALSFADRFRQFSLLVFLTFTK